MPVITGAMQYPRDVVSNIRSAGCHVIALDALSLAEEAGNAKATNVVLMGAISTIMDFEEALWEQVITSLVPAKFLDVNLKAFRLGRMLKVEE